MSSIFFFFYNYSVYPLLLVVSWASSIFVPKIKTGFELRKKENGLYPWLRVSIKNPIWIHCASGEFEYAKALIREIKSKKPEEKILVTFFSPSYVKQIQNFQTQEKLIDIVLPFPWDCKSVMRNFFEHIQPKMILFSRTDLWPQILREAKKRKIKTILYSALLSEKSSKVTNPIVRWLYSFLLGYVDQIYCVTTEDKKNFDKITDSKKVFVTGDTRFDQVFFRLNHPKELKPIFNDSKILVCGSTWSQDEKIIIPTFSAIIEKGIKIVIAPHEPTPTHLKSLEDQFQKLGLSAQRYSETDKWTSSILIIDQIGILAELYSKAQFAFIGGSFKKQIHSVMEALACGCYTFFGPYYINNREAIDFQKLEVTTRVSVCYSFKTPEEFVAAIFKRVGRNLPSDQRLIKNSVLQKTGASSKIAASLSS